MRRGCKSISDQELQGTGNVLFAMVFLGQGCYQVQGSVWCLQVDTIMSFRKEHAVPGH